MSDYTWPTTRSVNKTFTAAGAGRVTAAYDFVPNDAIPEKLETQENNGHDTVIVPQPPTQMWTTVSDVAESILIARGESYDASDIAQLSDEIITMNNIKDINGRDCAGERREFALIWPGMALEIPDTYLDGEQHGSLDITFRAAEGCAPLAPMMARTMLMDTPVTQEITTMLDGTYYTQTAFAAPVVETPYFAREATGPDEVLSLNQAALDSRFTSLDVRVNGREADIAARRRARGPRDQFPDQGSETTFAESGDQRSESPISRADDSRLPEAEQASRRRQGAYKPDYHEDAASYAAYASSGTIDRSDRRVVMGAELSPIGLYVGRPSNMFIGDSTTLEEGKTLSRFTVSHEDIFGDITHFRHARAVRSFPIDDQTRQAAVLNLQNGMGAAQESMSLFFERQAAGADQAELQQIAQEAVNDITYISRNMLVRQTGGGRELAQDRDMFLALVQASGVDVNGINNVDVDLTGPMVMTIDNASLATRRTNADGSRDISMSQQQWLNVAAELGTMRQRDGESTADAFARLQETERFRGVQAGVSLTFVTDIAQQQANSVEMEMSRDRDPAVSQQVAMDQSRALWNAIDQTPAARSAYADIVSNSAQVNLTTMAFLRDVVNNPEQYGLDDRRAQAMVNTVLGPDEALRNAVLNRNSTGFGVDDSGALREGESTRLTMGARLQNPEAQEIFFELVRSANATGRDADRYTRGILAELGAMPPVYGEGSDPIGVAQIDDALNRENVVGDLNTQDIVYNLARRAEDNAKGVAVSADRRLEAIATARAAAATGATVVNTDQETGQVVGGYSAESVTIVGNVPSTHVPVNLQLTQALSASPESSRLMLQDMASADAKSYGFFRLNGATNASYPDGSLSLREDLNATRMMVVQSLATGESANSLPAEGPLYDAVQAARAAGFTDDQLNRAVFTQVEAVRATDPNLFNELTTQTMDQLANSPNAQRIATILLEDQGGIVAGPGEPLTPSASYSNALFANISPGFDVSDGAALGIDPVLIADARNALVGNEIANLQASVAGVRRGVGEFDVSRIVEHERTGNWAGLYQEIYASEQSFETQATTMLIDNFGANRMYAANAMAIGMMRNPAAFRSVVDNLNDMSDSVTGGDQYDNLARALDRTLDRLERLEQNNQMGDPDRVADAMRPYTEFVERVSRKDTEEEYAQAFDYMLHDVSRDLTGDRSSARAVVDAIARDQYMVLGALEVAELANQRGELGRYIPVGGGQDWRLAPDYTGTPIFDETGQQQMSNVEFAAQRYLIASGGVDETGRGRGTDVRMQRQEYAPGANSELRDINYNQFRYGAAVTIDNPHQEQLIESSTDFGAMRSQIRSEMRSGRRDLISNVRSEDYVASAGDIAVNVQQSRWTYTMSFNAENAHPRVQAWADALGPEGVQAFIANAAASATVSRGTARGRSVEIERSIEEAIYDAALPSLGALAQEERVALQAQNEAQRAAQLEAQRAAVQPAAPTYVPSTNGSSYSAYSAAPVAAGAVTENAAAVAALDPAVQEAIRAANAAEAVVAQVEAATAGANAGAAGSIPELAGGPPVVTQALSQAQIDALAAANGAALITPGMDGNTVAAANSARTAAEVAALNAALAAQNATNAQAYSGYNAVDTATNGRLTAQSLLARMNGQGAPVSVNLVTDSSAEALNTLSRIQSLLAGPNGDELAALLVQSGVVSLDPSQGGEINLAVLNAGLTANSAEATNFQGSSDSLGILGRVGAVGGVSPWGALLGLGFRPSADDVTITQIIPGIKAPGADFGVGTAPQIITTTISGAEGALTFNPVTAGLGVLATGIVPGLIGSVTNADRGAAPDRYEVVDGQGYETVEPTANAPRTPAADRAPEGR